MICNESLLMTESINCHFSFKNKLKPAYLNGYLKIAEKVNPFLSLLVAQKSTRETGQITIHYFSKKVVP